MSKQKRGCPVCDKMCKTGRETIRHVVEEHMKANRPNVMTNYWRCWCGRCSYTLQNIEAHITQSGGVWQHFVECAFGLGKP